MVFNELLFKGFERIVETMRLEEVMECYISSEDLGCEPGFFLEFTASSKKTPHSLGLGIGYERQNPSILEVLVEATILFPEDVSDKECNTTRIARRVIASVKRTRVYRELVDYLGGDIEAYRYDVELEPSEPELGEERPGINVTVYAASSVPGLLLPFNLDPVLDMLEYLAKKLREAADKECR